MPLVLNGTTGVQDNSGAFVAGTAVASTSGTSIDFTGIPSWVKRVTINLQGVSTNGASALLIQLGAGSVTTSGYLGAAGDLIGNTSANYTAGFGTQTAGNATQIRHGTIFITNLSANNWCATGNLALSNGAQNFMTAGSIALGGTLDRVRVTTVNGTDTFDAGTINILYE